MVSSEAADSSMVSSMIRVSAPASSGNLGPAFDVIGLALDVRLAVAAERTEAWSVDHLGPASLPEGADDAVLAAAQKVSPDTPLAMTVNNAIPLARGLGSSSAAAAAGAAAAMLAAGGSIDHDRVFEVVCEFEGHADNAAATVFGGLMAVMPGERPHRLELHPDWRVVLAIPDRPLSTAEARRVLPPEVSRPAVVRSLSRLVALVEGLRTGDREVLRGAVGDELHETGRHDLNPQARELITIATGAGAAHACWSGAGPTVMAFVESSAAEDVVQALADASYDLEVRQQDISTTGLIEG